MNQAPALPRIIASGAALDGALVVLICAAGLLAVHVALDGLRNRSPVPLLALLGGVIALPIEPFWDVNVYFTFATNSHPIALTAFGRHIPLYLAFIYPAFIGWGSFIGYRLITGGASRRALLSLSLAFFAADAAIEVAGAHLSLWTYYGNQPLTVDGWPILFGVMNAAIPLLGGALLAVLAPRLPGWRRPLVALAVPTAYIGIYAIAGWPVWVALHASVSRAVVSIAGVAAVGIGLLAMWLVAEAAGAQTAPRTRRFEPHDLHHRATVPQEGVTV